MTRFRNALAGRSALSVPPGADFTAVNLKVSAPHQGGETVIGRLRAIGASGPVTVGSVNGNAASVGQAVPGSAGGRVRVAADGTLSFNPNGDFSGLADGQSATTLATAELTDGSGQDDALITVTVKAEPAAPVVTAPGAVGNLTVVINGTEAALDWSAPASNGAPITDYILRHRPVGSSTWIVANDGVSSVTSGTIPGLADGDYQFSIRAVNAAGTGPISNIATGTVATASAPVNQTAPVLGGSGVEGSVLGYTAGIWTGADTVSSALLRDGTAVPGWDGVSYTVQTGDAGAEFRIRETATNSSGTATAQSNSVAASASTPTGFGPLPGVLDAQNIIVLGASIIEDAFENEPQEVTDFAARMGFTGTIQGRATGGQGVEMTANALNNAQAEFAASAGSNLYLVHTGGNDVTAARPYPGGATELEAGLQTIFDDIATTGDVGVLSSLTKRYYNSAPQVVVGDPSTDANGSLPYVENVYIPFIETNLPDWSDQGQPVVDLYDLTDRYPEFIGTDGVHPTEVGQRAMHQYVLSRMAARAKGVRNTSRTGRSLVLDFGDAEGGDYQPAAINRIPRVSDLSPVLKNVAIGPLDQAGEPDHFVEVAVERFGGTNTAGQGLPAAARIADTRLHDAAMLGDSLFVGSATPDGTITLRHLTPGDTALITVAGSRNSGDANRRGDVTVLGQTLTLDAATIGASNQIRFAPVTVPASGEIAIRLDKRADSNFGYISGVIVDFIDPTLPFAQIDPTLEGAGAAGTSLGYTPGVYYDADQVTTELLRNGAVVAGFNGSAHNLTASDAGAVFQIRETATKAGQALVTLSNAVTASGVVQDPEAGLALTQTFGQGALANSGFDRRASAVMAVDLTAGPRPEGLIFEMGATAIGALVAFRQDGALLLRFGAGVLATPGGDHAFLRIPAGQIPVGPFTLAWEFNLGTGTIRAWADGVELTGENRADPRGEWAGTADGGLGVIGGGSAPFEPNLVSFNGAFASGLRYYENQTV